jgi:hypothetical protein
MLARAGGAALGLGLLAAVLYAMPGHWVEGAGVVGAAAVTAGAASAIGGALGFLFGIPKTVQSNGLAGRPVRYLTNTNLEDISDWLTKIIVGVGLVQIARLPGALERLGEWLAPLYGGRPHSAAFAIVYVCYFSISAFLLLYLWTRSRLRGVLQAADVDLTEKIEDALSQREDANAKALSVTERQLNGQTPPTQDDLDAAIEEASPDWLVQIYRRAEEQRHETWRTDKAAMARTIPVFRALIALDKKERFYRHFGSLAFALKDSAQPNYKAAVRLLTKTIRIRGVEDNAGLAMYEWNRAVCRIRLDPEFAAGRPSDSKRTQLIADDLRIGYGQLPAEFFAQDSPDPDSAAVGRWLALNNITLP